MLVYRCLEAGGTNARFTTGGPSWSTPSRKSTSIKKKQLRCQAMATPNVAGGGGERGSRTILSSHFFIACVANTADLNVPG